MDSTDLVRRDIDNLAPIAAEHLRNAMDRMQQARSVLSSPSDTKKIRKQAPTIQADTLANLEQGRRALTEQLVKAEEEANNPVDMIEELKQLQEQPRDLIKNQEGLGDDTATADPKDLASKAPKQGELKD